MAARPQKTEARRHAGGTPSTTGGERVSAEETAANASSNSVPRHPRNTLFHLAYHPARWGVVGGHCIPLLQRVPIKAGVDGMETIGQGANERVLWRQAHARLADAGWEVIPHGLGPDGESYVQRIQVRDGWHHYTVWETLFGGTDRISSDTDGYADWLKGLLASGHLSPVAPYAIEELRERIQSSLTAAIDKAATVPSYKEVVVAHQRELAAIDTMIKGANIKAKPVSGEAVTIAE